MSLTYAKNIIASRTALYNRKSMRHRTDEHKHYQTQTQRSQETHTKQRGVGKNGRDTTDTEGTGDRGLYRN